MMEEVRPLQPCGLAEAIAYLGLQIGMLMARVNFLEEQVSALQEQLAEHVEAHEDDDL